MGMEMPSWYDIYHLDDNPNRPRENLEDVQQSVQYLQSIIQNETGMLKLQVPKAYFWQLRSKELPAVALNSAISQIFRIISIKLL